MKERIKKLRQDASLTQQQFSERLHVSRNNIAGYETGIRVPSEAVISLICREFHVKEAWLRTGEGDMYEPESEDISSLLEGLGEVDIEIIKIFAQLPPEHRKVLRDFAAKVSAAAPAVEQITLEGLTAEEVAWVKQHRKEIAADIAAEKTIEEKLAEYRAELEAEQATQGKLSVLPNSKEEMAIA
ncbi:MAG: helix-turn-helix transcriptional regulator [Selenomonadaceae bacterium]|nr:helix-turn-helix transcriptional regulator [Selenomonadaceae bacterium]